MKFRGNNKLVVGPGFPAWPNNQSNFGQAGKPGPRRMARSRVKHGATDDPVWISARRRAAPSSPRRQTVRATPSRAAPTSTVCASAFARTWSSRRSSASASTIENGRRAAARCAGSTRAASGTDATSSAAAPCSPGLTAQRGNADALVALIRKRLGDTLIATANDPCLESWLAFMGSLRARTVAINCPTGNSSISTSAAAPPTSLSGKRAKCCAPVASSSAAASPCPGQAQGTYRIAATVALCRRACSPI